MKNPMLTDLIENCGLPQEMISKEVHHLIKSHGFSEDSLTLEQLREVMADYMQNILLDLKEEYSKEA